VADVNDALRSDRPYQPAWDLSRTLAELGEHAGDMFDPELAKLFIAYLEDSGQEVERANPPVLLHGRQQRRLHARPPAFVPVADSAL
jgi:HD-GYP domain-containing protein (c-di-GMP phosphodiesterase class II)